MSDAQREADRALGNAEGRLGRLEKDVSEMRSDLKGIADTLAQAKGGWRTLMLVIGLSATIGALVGKVAAFLGVVK